MDDQNKKLDDQNKKKETYEGLFIPTHQLSGSIVGALVVATILFVGGYVIGKKQAVDQLMVQVEHDVFADQIYSSLCSLYDADAFGEQVASAISEKQEKKGDDVPETSLDAVAQDSVLSSTTSATSYVGQLLSYHGRQQAEEFVRKCARKKVPLEVKTRKSVTASGKTRKWYQVVTKPYTDRHALEQVMEQIAYEENIKGAQIIACS